VSSIDILDSTHDDSKCHFQGVLVACDNEPRNIEFPDQSPRKRKQAFEGNRIADFLLVDQTGPIGVSVWGDFAEQICLLWRELQQARGCGTIGRCIVDLKRVRIQNLPKSSWNGEVLTRIRSLASVEAAGSETGTMLQAVNIPSTPNMISMSFAVPSHLCCISNYHSVRNKLRSPFRASFKGYIMDVEPVEVSQAGNQKCKFDLVDNHGVYITFCAMKHNCESAALKQCQEAVVYFGTGRGPKGSSPGMVYLMKDAMIIPVGKPRLLLASPKRDHLEICDA
jgi:hypothetical protein